MRDKSPQNLAIIFTLFCFLLLSQLQIIHATEPQDEIRIQSENTNIYDVFVPIDRNDDSTIKSITLSVPLYLREGYIEESTACKKDDEKESIVCTNPEIPTELHFRWDTREVMEMKYCEEIMGEKQTSQSWVRRYVFNRTGSFSWTWSILINDFHVNEGLVSDTYADLTTKSGYAVLWSFGSMTGEGADTVRFGGNSGKRPLLGTLESISGSPTTLYIVDRHKNTIDISSAKLTACSVSDITSQSFDHVVQIEYFGEDMGDKVDEVSFAPLHITYNTVESTFSPTETPTLTPSPTLTHTPSPTPTLNVIVVNSATATPTPSQNSKNEILNSNTTVTETPTFTPTQIPNTKLEILNSNERRLDDARAKEDLRKLSGGEVLGTSTETSVKKSENVVVTMLLWMGGFLTLGLLAIGIRRKTKHTITIFLFLGIWFIGSCKVYASAPQLLVKITDPRTYYARSTNGSIDLITYPPNFYFEGVKPVGRVVLSSTPDGTGNVSLGNGGFLTRTLTYWSSTQNFGMNPPTNTGNCYAAQNIPPRELPIQYFNSENTTYNVRATFQGYCFSATPWQVSTLYLVYFPPEPTSTPTITPSPTNTPTPTPTTVPPFLDLPWDYASDNLTFSEAALRMTTYFDHEYPTLSINGMFDQSNMIIYSSSSTDRTNHYSSHDGYDYANPSKVSYGDDQLAAASGITSYHYDKWSGHAIFIDHKNGYQTRYYHMQPDGLVVSVQGATIAVRGGQKIGKVGYSGNVSPAGLDGAHIHFMVIYDKNNDGNFQDNIPDGIVDPFGWQGEGADPWETFQFDYAGKTRTGMKSTYLWKTTTASQNEQVGSSGGEVKNEKVKLTIPPLVLPDLLQFFIKSAPRTKIDEHTESVGSIADITAVDGGGIAVKNFSQPINISFTYSTDDALYYDPDYMSIYSSPDGAIWQKEQTLIDHDAHTATTSVNHLTFFALMGERRDTIAPLTSAKLTGEGREVNFRSDVTLELLPEDAIGTDYTLYRLDEGEWEEYIDPVNVVSEGVHILQYFSVDTCGNVESVQTMEYTVDKTIPEIELHYDHDTHEFIFSTEPDSTINEQSEDMVIAEDNAGNVNVIHYQKTVEDGLTTVEFVGDHPGLYAISDEYEYFQSGEVTMRKIPTESGKLSIDVNDEISEETASTSLHIITNHGKLEIHD